MKKILFNDKFLLTKAVLDDRKTQTRRICQEQVWAHSDIINAENGIFHFEIPKYKVGSGYYNWQYGNSALKELVRKWDDELGTKPRYIRC